MSTKIPSANLNHFKVFVAVFETLSMTGAAKNLHLTQSGVSQHIQALEEDLGTPLFVRVGRKLLPTPVAREIYPEIATAFTSVAGKLAQVTGRAADVEGVVRIGMPVEFGTNVLVPKLSEVGKKHRKVTFDITLDYASEVIHMLLDGALDFAYVDETPLNRRVSYQAVASEELQLCCHADYLQGQASRVTYSQSYFESLDYIDYKGSEPILRRWMLHNLKRQNLRLNVRAHIMDVQGVARFIASGLGVGVLPDHVVARMKNNGVNLHVFEGRSKPLRNEIRLICLKNDPPSGPSGVIFNELRLG